MAVDQELIIPDWVVILFVAALIAGFTYLVATANRGLPDSPRLVTSINMSPIYTMPQNGTGLASDCEREMHIFNLSGKETDCYRCKNTSQTLFKAVPGGGWICPI